MSYEDVGRGEDLVLVPASSGHHGQWRFQIIALSPFYRCIALDLRGGGGSDKPQGVYTVKLLADDVVALMDSLGIDAAHIVGQSLGSAITQQVAIDHPQRVKSVSLHSTWAKTDEWLRLHFQTTKYLILNTPEVYGMYRKWRLYSQRAVASGLADQMESSRQGSGGDREAKARFYDADTSHDAADRLGQIAVPALVTGGEEDICVPHRYAEEVHRLISQSRYHLFRGEGSSHSVYIERYEEFNALQLEFLKSV